MSWSFKDYFRKAIFQVVGLLISSLPEYDFKNRENTLKQDTDLKLDIVFCELGNIYSSTITI